MNNLENQTLANIVTEEPRSAHVMEKYHLDFCCRGKRSLHDACAEKGLNLQTVIREIESVQKNAAPVSGDTVANYPPAALAAYIVKKHHEYVRFEIPLLLGYLQKVAAKHGDRHPEMRQVLTLFREVAEELMHHMLKEEMVLFPRIGEVEKQMESGQISHFDNRYLQAPIEMMKTEHESAGQIMADIRTLLNNYTVPADACTTYKLCFTGLEAFETDLHRHVHLENYILFPKAMSLLESVMN